MPTLTEINKPLYKSLRELGLSDGEANAYIVALQLGPSSVTTIAENLDIARPNAYKVLNVLQRYDLVNFSGEGYGRTVNVEPPSVVLEKLRNKEGQLKIIQNSFVANMPSLLQLYQQGSSPTKIRIINGTKQFGRAFDNILEEAQGESQFFGSAEDFIGFVSWRNERAWIKKRIQKGIKINALLLPGRVAYDLQKKDRQELREIRTLRGAEPFSGSFHLYANKAIIWQPKAPLAVLIEDQVIVQMLRSIFKLLWSRADTKAPIESPK